MKYFIQSMIFAFAALGSSYVYSADLDTNVKTVCVNVKKDGKDVKDPKTGKTKQSCKQVKQHKKLDVAK